MDVKQDGTPIKGVTKNNLAFPKMNKLVTLIRTSYFHDNLIYPTRKIINYAQKTHHMLKKKHL